MEILLESILKIPSLRTKTVVFFPYCPTIGSWMSLFRTGISSCNMPRRPIGVQDHPSRDARHGGPNTPAPGWRVAICAAVALGALSALVYLVSTPTPLPRTALLSYPHSHRRADVGNKLVDGVSTSWAREPARASVLVQLPGRTQQLSAAYVGPQGIKQKVRRTELHILTAHERGEFREMREEAHMKRFAAQVGRWSALRSLHTLVAAASAGRQQSSAGRQQLAHWPYEHSSAIMGKGERLDTLGRAIDDSAPEERQLIKHYILDEFQHKPGTPMLDDGRAEYSEANPPCYTAEDCHRFAAQQPGSHLQKKSDLPVYDNDMLDLVSFGKC